LLSATDEAKANVQGQTIGGLLQKGEMQSKGTVVNWYLVFGGINKKETECVKMKRSTFMVMKSA
jgi:hypothetical protein